MKPIFSKTFAFLASYGLSCVLFLLLLLLTYLGTLHQVEHGLHEAQTKYFTSFFLVHQAFGVVAIPLPGGALLLGILFVNLLCGGIVRARKGWNRLGVLLGHVGIAVLLAGGMVTGLYSANGNMSLREGESASYFESYTEWEIVVSKAGGSGTVTEYIITEDEFRNLKGDRAHTFIFDELPLDLRLSGYAKNAAPQPSDSAGAPGKVVGGRRLAVLPPVSEAERNTPGLFMTVVDKASGEEEERILWGMYEPSVVASSDGAGWVIDLHRRRWQLPFSIRLDQFTRELHPGTSKPKSFQSSVTRIEGDTAQEIEITMNEPLRHKGYTFYQSSWGSSGAGPNAELYSVLSVVRNPADQFPLYACVIITLGLVVHFSQRLTRYLRKESARQA